MIEALILAGLFTAWLAGSRDRVAAPARAAARAGAGQGARAAARETRSRWVAGQPGRGARAARGRARLAGWRLPAGSRTVPVGRVLNGVADGVQHAAAGIARVAGGAAAVGWVTARETGRGARDGWRAGRAAHADRRETRRRLLILDDRPAGTVPPGNPDPRNTPPPDPEPSGGAVIRIRPRTTTTDQPTATPDQTRPGGFTMTTTTAGHVTVELTSIDDLIKGLQEIATYLTDVLPTVRHYAEVAAALPDTQGRFRPDDDTQAALLHVAETAPEEDRLGAWLEAWQAALKAAEGFKAAGEGLRGTGAEGDLQAAVGE